jgi:hypothetical protein
MKTYGGMVYNFLAVDGGEWTASRLSRFARRYHWIGKTAGITE